MIAIGSGTVVTGILVEHVTEPRTKLFRVVCKFLVAVPEVTKILTGSRAFTNSRRMIVVFTY